MPKTPPLKRRDPQFERLTFAKHRRQISRQAWLIMHASHEGVIGGAVYRHFRQQGIDLARRIERGGIASLALESFSVSRETQELLRILEPHFQRAMVIAAMSIRESVTMQRWASDDKDFDLSEFAVELPSQVVAGIRAAVKELVSQPWWTSIAEWSKKNLGELIRTGIHDGKSNKEIAKAIRQATGGAASKKRSLAIARSETTGALNRGHLESLNELASHDAGASKIWSAIVDDRTRDSHAAISGQVRPVNELFSNGGRYPGDPLLPSAERVNCRCTLVADVSLL